MKSIIGGRNLMQIDVIIIGVGPGLGLSLAKVFGQQGNKLLLVARDKNNLKKIKQKLNQLGIEAEIFIADVASPTSVSKLFSWLNKNGLIPKIMIYNAADVKGNEPDTIILDQLENIFKINVFGLVNCAQKFLKLDPKFKFSRSILVTGGELSDHPRYKNTSLSMTKAALKNYTIMLGQKLPPDKVAVNMITVNTFMNKPQGMKSDKVAKEFLNLQAKHKSGEIMFPPEK